MARIARINALTSSGTVSLDDLQTSLRQDTGPQGDGFPVIFLADYSDREIQAALEVNIPNYAIAIITADEMMRSSWRFLLWQALKWPLGPDHGFS